MHPAAPFRFAVVLVLLLAARCAGAVDDLTKAKTVYTDQLQTIREASEQAKSDALVGYRRAIDQLRQKAKQDGDLDAAQALDAEIKRFEQQKAPPATPASEDLTRAASACRDALKQAEVDGAKKVVQLTEKYLAFLDQRVKQAVREDRLDVAKTFKAEMDAAKETPAYQAATFVLAENQPAADAVTASTADAHRPAPTNGPPAAVPQPGAEKTRLHSSPDGLYDAARITDGPPAAAMGAPSPYRGLLAMESGRAPQAGGLVGVTLDGYQENATHYQLRVKLRPKTAEVVQNLKLLVQYFVRNTSGGAIQESVLQYAPIASVSSKSVSCEMKPAEFSSSGYTVHTPRGNELTIITGREGAFIGVVVSVFAADDKLLAQVVSVPSLKDRGRTTFEAPPQWQEHPFDATENGPGPVIRIRRRFVE